MPSLQITTLTAENIAAGKAYVLYALGGFRRQTMTVSKNGIRHDWNKDEMFPVSSASKTELEIVVYEPSKFGDKHCGSVKVIWPDLSFPHGVLQEHTLTLGGINANKATLKLAFLLDAPVSLPTQTQNRSINLASSMRLDASTTQNNDENETERPSINPALAALVKSSAPIPLGMKTTHQQQSKITTKTETKQERSLPKRAPSPSESIKLQAVTPIDLKETTDKVASTLISNLPVPEQSRLSPIPSKSNEQPSQEVTQTKEDEEKKKVKKVKKEKRLTQTNSTEQTQETFNTAKSSPIKVPTEDSSTKEKESSVRTSTSILNKDSDSDEEIGIRGVLGGKRIGNETNQSTEKPNTQRPTTQETKDQGHLDRVPLVKLKEDGIQPQLSKGMSINRTSRPSSASTSNSEIKQEQFRPPSSSGFVKNETIQPIPSSATTSERLSPNSSQVLISNPQVDELDNTVRVSRPSLSTRNLHEPSTTEKTQDLENSRTDNSKGLAKVDSSRLGKASDYKGSTSLPSSLSPIPQPNLLGQMNAGKNVIPSLDSSCRDSLDDLTSSTDLGITKGKPQKVSGSKVVGTLGTGVPVVNLLARKQEQNTSPEDEIMEQYERPPSASSKRSSRSLGKDALALVMGSSDEVREFLDMLKLNRFAEKLITSGTDSMDALKRLSVDDLTVLGFRPNHIQTLQKGLTSYFRRSDNISPDPDLRPASASSAPDRPQSSRGAVQERPTSVRGAAPPERPISSGEGFPNTGKIDAKILEEDPIFANEISKTPEIPVQDSLDEDEYGYVKTIWQYMDDTGEWCTYDPLTTRKLAKAKAVGQKEISAQVDGNSYVIDLCTMESIDLLTCMSWPIRELASLEDGEVANWFWMNDDGEWIEYNNQTAKLLSEAQHSGSSTVTVKVDGENYMVNLRTLEQLDGEGISRPVRDRPLTSRVRKQVMENPSFFGDTGEKEGIWDWMDNDGRWRAFSDEISEQLSQAKTNEQTSININVDNVVSIVNVSEMVLYDPNGISRPVRQRPTIRHFNPLDSAYFDSTSSPWYWMDDTGDWVEYDSTISNYLSDVLNKGEDSGYFQIGGHAFKVDPWNMEQADLRSNICRPITREPIPLDWGDTPIYGGAGVYGASEQEAALAVQYNPTNPQASSISPSDICLNSNGKELVYNGAKFPYPLDPVTDARPDILYERIHQKRLEEMKQKDEQHNRQQANSEQQSPGIFKNALNKFKGTFGDATHGIAKTSEMAGLMAEKKARQLQLEKYEKDYKKNFTGIQDRLIAVYSCTYAAGDGAHKGQLYFTEGHVLFQCELKPLRFGIPLAEIVSIQKAVVMGSAAIQLFTLQRGFYQMADFTDIVGDVLKQLRQTVQGTAYDRAYNYLDHLWREKAEVPNPSVQYLPPCSLFVH